MGREEAYENEEEEVGEKLVAPPDFDGPVKNRRCTDVLCTLLIIAVWTAMTALGLYSIQQGDARVVLYPLDYDGNICGTDYGSIDMTDYPYLYYVNYFSGGVCVKECPQLEENLTDVFTAITYGGLYQTEDAWLPPDYIQVANYSSSDDAQTCSGVEEVNTCYPFGSAALSWVSSGINKGFGYAFYAVDTYEVLRRCIADSDAIDELKEIIGSVDVVATSDAGSDDSGFWGNLYGDLFTARLYILGVGFGASVVIGFVYSLFLRVPGFISTFVWTSIALTIGMFAYAGYYANTKAAEWADEVPQVYSDSSIAGARISSYILWFISAAFFLLVCFLRRAIQLAMGCVKEASRAIGSMPMIITYPIVQSVALFGFMAIWLVYAVFLVSLGEVKSVELDFSLPASPFNTQVAVRTYEFSDFVERAGWFLIFCYFWTSLFIRALGEIAVAMAIAKWYFTRDKSRIHSGTIWSSAVASLFYHSGTAAFGSLIIALIKVLRWFIAKLQKKAKEVGSKVVQSLLCCCQCCLWCFEKCIKFLNKNAYIQTAIFGTNFCTSAREAFYLIVRNAGRIGAITYVSTGVIIVGRIFITATTSAIAYFLMQERIDDKLHSLTGPVLLVALIAYYVSGTFMGVFGMAVSTILQCFVADEEMFSGEGRYAEGALRKFVDEYADEERKIVTGDVGRR